MTRMKPHLEELARFKLSESSREHRRDMRYAGIVRTFDAYMETAENPTRQRAVHEAATAWDVSDRTVESALTWRGTEPTLAWARTATK